MEQRNLVGGIGVNAVNVTIHNSYSRSHVLKIIACFQCISVALLLIFSIKTIIVDYVYLTTKASIYTTSVRVL